METLRAGGANRAPAPAARTATMGPVTIRRTGGSIETEVLAGFQEADDAAPWGPTVQGVLRLRIFRHECRIHLLRIRPVPAPAAPVRATFSKAMPQKTDL